MNENKVHVGESIRVKDSDKMIGQIRMLIARHNTLCAVEKAIRESDVIAELYNEVEKEMSDAGNASMAALLALTIEAANAKIHDLEDDSTNDIALREKARRLEKENEELRLRIETIEKIVTKEKR